LGKACMLESVGKVAFVGKVFSAFGDNLGKVLGKFCFVKLL